MSRLESLREFIASLKVAQIAHQGNTETPLHPAVAVALTDREGGAAVLQVEFNTVNQLCGIPFIMQALRVRNPETRYALASAGMFLWDKTKRDLHQDLQDPECLVEIVNFLCSCIKGAGEYNNQDALIALEVKNMEAEQNFVQFTLAMPCSENAWNQLMIVRKMELETAELWANQLGDPAINPFEDLAKDRTLN